MSEERFLRAKDGRVAVFEKLLLQEKHALPWIAAAADARAPESVKELAKLLSECPTDWRHVPLDKADREMERRKTKDAIFAKEWRKAWAPDAPFSDQETLAEAELGAQSSIASWAALTEKNRQEWIRTIKFLAVEKTGNPAMGHRVCFIGDFPKSWIADPQGLRGLHPSDAWETEAEVNRWLAIAKKAPLARAEAKQAGITLPPLRPLSDRALAFWEEMAPQWEEATPLAQMQAGAALFAVMASEDGYGNSARFLGTGGDAVMDLSRAKLFGDKAAAEKWGAANANRRGWGVVEIKAQFIAFEPKAMADKPWATPLKKLAAGKESEFLRAEIEAAGDHPNAGRVVAHKPKKRAPRI